MSKRVLIGMSGGIDSTVAAILLQEQGYELVGLIIHFVVRRTSARAFTTFHTLFRFGTTYTIDKRIL